MKPAIANAILDKHNHLVGWRDELAEGVTPEDLIAAHEALDRHAAVPARHNPGGWRWRLVLWLTGGEIDAVPIAFHARPHHTDVVRIALGQPGALNTADLVCPDDER